MLDDYIIIHKSVLPDYFAAVLKAKSLLEERRVESVSQAAKEAGISRSTYYKYKDFVLEPSHHTHGRSAVISMMLIHEMGTLSNVLTEITKSGSNILTISQTLPIKGKASVTLTLDISSMNQSLPSLIEDLSKTKGVENPRLVTIE